MKGNHLINGKYIGSIVMLIALFAGIFHSCSNTGAGDAGPETLRLYIGSYADSADAGIYLYEFSIPDREFRKIQEIRGHRNPSFLALHPEGDFLYAVNEIAGFKGENSGSVTAFSVEAGTGRLTFINSQPSLGAHPCHISVLPDGNHVAVANYSGGSVALLPVAGNGALEKPSGFAQHEGSGPDSRRQRSAHAHSVYPFGDGSAIIAADLGTDMVMIYRSGDTGSLDPAYPNPSVSMKPGSGPRHIAIHPAGRWIYVINELNSTITRIDFDENSGSFSVMESVSTLPEKFEDENYCADIRIHPGGRFLYASNRGHNSIAVFELAPDGAPVLVSHEPSGGDWPRNFNIDPSGSLLMAANQRSGNIAVFEIDRDTGLLEKTDAELRIDQPVCVEFARF